MLTYTNSSLTTFDRCPRKFDLRYRQRLSPVDEDSETLAVGATWHHAHDVQAKGLKVVNQAAADEQAYLAIAKRAPGELWAEKLRRLFAAYAWRWKDEPLDVVESELVFECRLEGNFIGEGQIDGVVRIDDEYLGIIERKTTGEDIGEGAAYWDRLRMDSQLSFYAHAFHDRFGTYPRFILYDVVRKPTIRPKSLVQKDVQRMRMELTSQGYCTYFAEAFGAEELEAAVFHGQETARMYGARLTSDIGDRPDFYFARRVIPRTALDAKAASLDVGSKIAMERFLAGGPGEESFYPRSPMACMDWNRPCEFIGLCSNNEYPRDEVPTGFRRREHLHPELHPTDE